MKFHAFHSQWLIIRNGEFCPILGFAMGRVSGFPDSKYLYSLRVFLILFRLEILWTTGKPPQNNPYDY